MTHVLPRAVAMSLLGTMAGAGGGPQQPEIFTSAVESVRLDVLVTEDDSVVRGLSADDFEVFDNDVRQQVEVVPNAQEAVDAILALDTSESVSGGRLDSLRQAAEAFLETLTPNDSLTLLAFSGKVRWLGMPGDRPEFVRSALRRLVAGHNTVLHDALYVSLLMADAGRGRPLVIVMSDGDDRGSWLSLEQVLDAARASDAVVHAVRVRQRGGRRASSRSGDVLAGVALATGGDVTTLRRDEDIRGTFLQILGDFRSRYRLRFEPSVPTPGWHELRVRVPGRRAKVRARNGYVYAPPRP